MAQAGICVASAKVFAADSFGARPFALQINTAACALVTVSLGRNVPSSKPLVILLPTAFATSAKNQSLSLTSLKLIFALDVKEVAVAVFKRRTNSALVMVLSGLKVPSS